MDEHILTCLVEAGVVVLFAIAGAAACSIARIREAAASIGRSAVKASSGRFVGETSFKGRG